MTDDNVTVRASPTTDLDEKAPYSEEAPEKHTINAQNTRDFGVLPIPPWLRHDPSRPAHFGLLLNVVFGLASTFST